MRQSDQWILLAGLGVLVLLIYYGDAGDEVVPEPPFRPFNLPSPEPEWAPPDSEPAPVGLTEQEWNRLRFHKRRLAERKVAP